jgi:deoxyribose-phosphate aldolase
MIESLSSKTITYKQLAKVIDHSLLKPELTEAEVIAGCQLAEKYQVASVCVKPCHVKLAVELLSKTDVAVGTVISFPHGSSTTATKVFETKEAILNGAVELDMVMNIGAMKAGDYRFVEEDITAVVNAARGKALVKVIFENAYLTDTEKIAACRIAEKAGADFVKTSTGFASSGATVEDIKLMRASVSEKIQVKAAHGVRTLSAILDMIDAGATRCGATATVVILDEFEDAHPDRS